MEMESNPLNKEGKFVGVNSPNHNKTRTHTKRNICLAITALLLLIILIVVILAVTVFKPKKPKISITSVSLSDFDFSVNLLKAQIGLNLTLATILSVKNPNRVGFSYKNSSAVLRYHGRVVGEAPVPAGTISAGERKEMNISLTLMGDRFVSDPNLFSDVVTNGQLPLNTFTKISGKVRILFFRIHVVSSTSCDMVINVATRSVASQSCDYKTEL